MHKLIATMVFLAAGNVAMAQNHFFLHPYIGGGSTGVLIGRTNFPKGELSNTTSTTAGIKAGRTLGNFRISIGLVWLTTGSRYNNLTFEHFYNPGTGLATDSVDVIYTNKHILMPLTFGYAINLGKKLTVIPELGVAASYNPSVLFSWKYHATGKTEKDVYRGTSSIHKKHSLFGNASVLLAYNLNSHIAITFGPAYTQMLNPIISGPFTSELNYALTANAGVMLKL